MASQESQPLLQSSESNNIDKSKASALETAVKQGARGAALLAKHLPTGSALVFQVLAPITTARGKCTVTSRIETITLISLCVVSSTFLTFTDSFKDGQNKIRYGIATCKGLLVLDGTPPPSDQEKYKIKGLDFVHVITNLVIFSAVVLYNNHVVKCFWGKISEEEYLVQAFTAAPVLIGILGSILFVFYPSNRHGLGFPVGGLSLLEVE